MIDTAGHEEIDELRNWLAAIIDSSDDATSARAGGSSFAGSPGSSWA
jgi:hypothetical protein